MLVAQIHLDLRTIIRATLETPKYQKWAVPCQVKLISDGKKSGGIKRDRHITRLIV